MCLEAQLKFRKHVLEQKQSDKTIYNLNERGKSSKLTIQQLDANMLALVKDILKEPTQVSETQGKPLLVGGNDKHKLSDRSIYDGYVIFVVPGFSMPGMSMMKQYRLSKWNRTNKNLTKSTRTRAIPHNEIIIQ